MATITIESANRKCFVRNDNVKSNKLAETPPMGWNSWICFGTSVTDAEVKSNADFMSSKLKETGWEYIVIDGGWYAHNMVTLTQYESKLPVQLIDNYGRLIPDVEKFPTSINSKGFKALADYIHSKGLKFGLHIMRGIPIQAIKENSPIKGTKYHARDIVNFNSQCTWNFGFYGIDMTKPGAQEYYNSLFELYESWGVDYVKADDLLSPVYNYDEIQAISNAVKSIKRPIVLSLSPGPAPVENVNHLMNNAQLWRISDDFWDDWAALKKQFPLCNKWSGYVGSGHWPDADMLPIGPMAQRAMRGTARQTNFTKDEQYTLLSLWAMFRSPLMLGCNLPEMDDFTLKLITNKEVIAINQQSKNNKQWFAKDEVYGWFAIAQDNSSDYVAIFNTSDETLSAYEVDLNNLNRGVYKHAIELWTNNPIPVSENKVLLTVKPHGVILLKLIP